MKKLFLVCLCLVAISIIGCEKAQEAEAHTINNITNVQEQDNEFGAGADVILHEGEDGEILNQLHAEYRYDWNNDEGNHKAYLVGTTKLADIWAKVKSIFNKE